MRPDEQHLQAWRALLEAHAALVRRLNDELQVECGLPLTWYDALVQLHEAGGRLRMGELADRLLLSRSATTRFADRLESAGLVVRRPVEDDRRGTEVALSEEGLATLRSAAPVHLRGIAEHFAAGLDAEEAVALTGLLARFGRR